MRSLAVVCIEVIFFFQALPLLGDYVRNEDSSIRIAAILGLGLAYAGSHCPQVRFPCLLRGDNLELDGKSRKTVWWIWVTFFIN